MTIQEMKALPRTAEGIFDMEAVMAATGAGNAYAAAWEIYPAYVEYETKENGKNGYPDIMAQMRVWNGKIEGNWADGAAYAKLLLLVVENMSPEIYENYRELLDMFRKHVKNMLNIYYDGTKVFCVDEENTKLFCDTVRKACEEHLLLAEKYQMCF